MYDKVSDRGTHWTMRAMRDYSLPVRKIATMFRLVRKQCFSEGTATDSDCCLASKWGRVKGHGYI